MIFERLKKLLAEQFGLDQDAISEDTDFEELGADSVDLVELSMNLEEEFGVEELGEEDIAGIRTVGDLVAFLRGKLSE